MERKKFIQYSALSSASFLANISITHLHTSKAMGAESTSNKPLYDWILLYWMPYDNNLSQFGKPILDMLAKGVQSDNILVLVQSKLWGDKNLSRHIISQGNINAKKLESTNSASEEVFAEYLNWAQSQYQAKKWAIAILGHGGTLDKISPDDHPNSGSNTETQWMNIQKMSSALAHFNQQVNNRVELFFFQNCNKGTLEATYTLRDTAKYTLSSQFLLGAPNYYYEPLLGFLGQNPDIDGGQLAEKIMEFEPKNMYQSYTAINNQAFQQLPAKINPLIDAVLAANLQAINISNLETYDYMEERFVDLVALLQTITEQSGAHRQRYDEFIEFFNNSLIYKVKKEGTLIEASRKYQQFSGLGVFLPQTRKDLDPYRYLQIFSDLKLVELFDLILV